MEKYAVFLFLLLIGSSFARTYSVPLDEPIATVRIPDNWPTQQRGEYIDATMPDDAGHVLVVPVEGPKVADSMGDAMRYIRRTGTIKVKADSINKETTNSKGREVRIVSWDATDQTRPIKIRCHIILAGERKRLLVVFWGSLRSQEKHLNELNRLLESIEAPTSR
jgi:hypothetical protein